MSTAKRFNRVLHDQIRIHAAWLPVTNSFQVGDFGVISGGVFNKMGNIAQFGVPTPALQDGPPASIDFKSERTRIVRFVGAAEVTALPDEPIAASLKIEFERENSFFLKAATLKLQQMSEMVQVARQLGEQDGWRRKWRVVSAVYNGESCVMLSSKSANSTVEISGNADALKRLELGSANAEFTIKSQTNLGLEIIGQTGVVGLKLFKLKRLSGSIDILSARSTELLEETEGAELDDDL